MWTLPVLVLGITFVLAIPIGRYMAWVFEGKYALPSWFKRIENRIDTGPQRWTQYALAFMLFNLLTLVVGFLVLTFQPHLPLNPDHKGMLSPTTIFHTAISFLTNTNQQHYSGEIHFSYFTQIFLVCWKQMLSPVLGLAVLVAIIRGLRGDKHMGNFYLDLWRGLMYFYVPLCFIVAVLLIVGGSPMTFQGNAEVAGLEQGAMGTGPDGHPILQSIARGPVAAIVAVKQFGTNGGGFFGANSTHPFENPNDWTNLLSCVGIILIPVATLVMFGKMINSFRHAAVIFGVMLVLSAASIVWVVYYDTMQPNPGLTAHAERTYEVPDRTAAGGKGEIALATVVGLPVDQSLGNLEGKELRFGTSAGATWAALTTNTSNGSVNCMHDSLNPLAGLTPITGMWLNCIWGGVGVGLINFLIYLIIGVFIAGLMVGRTPEYFGKKVEAREMKLAMLAFLIHPLLILGPTGLFAVTDWGTKATNNPSAHGFSEILYEFTSASANNGSGFEGLGDTYGFNNNQLAPYGPHWDISCGLVMVFGRFIPILAPLAFAGSLAAKKKAPMTAGTLRTDTFTFGCVLFGTILLLGALTILPAAVLGPVAEHLGPLPFGS